MRAQADVRFPLVLLALFAAFWTVLALAPTARDVWLVENLLVVLVVPAMFVTVRRHRFSNTAYTAVFAFLVLHAIGSHFTYGKVPLPLDLLDGDRNAYDRIVHFAFGALIVLPVWEIHRDLVRAPGAWPRFLAAETVLAASALYEVLEWLVIALAPAATAAGFLATQGDPFDAFKDVGLAGLGAALTMTLHAVLARQTPVPKRLSARGPADGETPSRRGP